MVTVSTRLSEDAAERWTGATGDGRRCGIEALLSAHRDRRKRRRDCRVPDPQSTRRVLSDSIYSVVAVHGLGVHPDDTWSKNRGTDSEPRWVNWLRDSDMLPAAVPN